MMPGTSHEGATMSLVNDPTTAIRDATQRIEPALIEIRRDIPLSRARYGRRSPRW
jgi:hypothetical protein